MKSSASLLMVVGLTLYDDDERDSNSTSLNSWRVRIN